MDTYFNEKFKEKVYLLEFVQANGSSEFFSFSVPPQSEDFSTPQKIGETKTFAGSVFEDYGNDVTKITLSGTTVNNKLRKLFKNGSGDVTTDGEGEIFALQNLIHKYGELNNLDKKSIYLYSLDSDNKFWQVLINEFQIKRSKDNPLAYTYTISFTGFPANSHVKFQYEKNELASVTSTTEDVFLSEKSNLRWYENIQSGCHKLCEDIKKFSSDIKECLSDYQEVYECVNAILDCIDEIDEALASLVDIYNGIINREIYYIEETLGVSTRVKSLFRITNATIDNVYNTAQKLVERSIELYNWFEHVEPDSIHPEILEMFGITYADDFVYDMTIISGDILFDAVSIKATLKQSVNTTKLLIVPGSDTQDDTVIVSYGYKSAIVKDSDTWDGLAFKYYGDSTLGGVIALYNGLENSESVLKMGNQIKIPIISQTESLYVNNIIYSTPDVTDNYGVDIKLTDNGSFKQRYNDFDVIEGKENLEQALKLRLQTGLSSRLKLATYGIKSIIGSPSKANNYVIASIRQTLLQEPRIKTIDSISFKGRGDTIDCKVIYTDINDIQQEYGGNI